MRLMREIEVPQTSRDQVFRASRLHAVLFVMVCLAACAAVIVYRWPAPRPSYYISAVILALLWLGHRFVTARFHPSNWLLRAGDEGLFIHFRSYLNDGMAGEDPTVVFFSYNEIRSARLVQEHIEKRGNQGESENQILYWVEFELAVDPAPVVAALAEERARPGPTEKRWYGSSTTLFQDYPVLIEKPPFLRVRWQVVPRAPVLLEALRPHVEIAPSVKVSADFANLNSLSQQEQAQRLRDLNARGETIAATYLAQKLYSCDLTQATHIVRGLTKEASP